MVDVGFGGDGATKPLPLISGLSVQNFGTQEIRLVFDTIPQLVDQSKPLWIYQYRNVPEQEWNSFYCFPELEFLPYDFEIMNYYTSTNMGEINFQTKTVLVIRFLRDKLEGSEEQGIVGKVMLVNGTLKRNDGGKTRAILVCKNESERLDVLKKHLSIELTEEEAACVKGRNVELLEG
jgi:arylamine N-acetyltransferase